MDNLRHRTYVFDFLTIGPNRRIVRTKRIFCEQHVKSIPYLNMRLDANEFFKLVQAENGTNTINLADNGTQLADLITYFRIKDSVYAGKTVGPDQLKLLRIPLVRAAFTDDSSSLS